MNRDVKFRAYHHKEKKMCVVETLRMGKGAFLIGLTPSEDQVLPELRMIVKSPENGRFCPIEGFDLMEFTGVKDKKGREIYEGDVLNDPLTDVRALVEYSDGAFCVTGYETFAVDLLAYLENSSSGTTVVGNIYENAK